MITFLAAGWLVALGAVALPLLLHLLGAGTERRVALGSVRFLRPAATRRGRRLRPSDPLLLVLRCALLAALAAALAAPRWPAPREEEAAADWVLADALLLEDPERWARETPRLAARLGALRRAGARVEPLAPSSGERREPVPDLWSRLRAADARAPAGAPFHLLVFDRLAALRGARPALDRRVEVVAGVVPGENRWIERWIERPWRGDGLVEAVVGHSNAARTRFERRTLAVGADGWLRLDDGGDEPGDDALRIAARASPARIAVRHAPARSLEAELLRAGFEAAAATLGLDLAVDVVADGLDTSMGVLMLLGRPPGEAERRWVEAGGWLVAEGDGAGTPCEGRAELPVGPRGVPVRLRRCPLDTDLEAGAVLAADGSGRALAVARRVGRGLEVRLRGDLSAASSDFVLHAAFPAALQTLLAARWPAATAALPESDRRAAGEAALAPEIAAPGARTAVGERPSSARPEALTWLLVAGLFVGERWLARRDTT